MTTMLDTITSDPMFPRRSEYAHELLTGERAISGADLQGKAKKWSSRYFDMRRRVANVALRHGAHIRKDAKTGRLSLVMGPAPAGAEESHCSLGPAARY